MKSSVYAVCVGLALTFMPGGVAYAQQKPAQKPAPAQNQGIAGFGGADSKEPIKIDSDRLDVFDKEKKAIFAGNVVAVQGETTMRCKTLTVFYEQGVGAQGGAGAKPAPAAAAQSGGDNGVRRLECAGPMTVVSKDQIATADNAIYDKAQQKVFLNGNAKLSQGENVTTGDRLIYDLATSRASVERKPGQRVRALLVPGSEDKQEPGAKPKQEKPKN